MCIYYKYTIYLHFSGPNSVSFPLFFPSLALWWICLRAFSSWAKAWMHIPRFGFVFVFFFLWNGYYDPRGELRSENQSSYDPLRVVFYITLDESSFAEHVCCPSVCSVEFGGRLLCTAEVKSCWLLGFFVDLSMGKETKSKWLDRLL